MRIRKLVNSNQKGFTLMEVVVAVALTAIVIGVIVTSVFQVFILNVRTSNHMNAVTQVQSAGYWLSFDAQMAQDVDVSGASGFPLTLTWTDWSGDEYQVVYSLTVGDKLLREHYTNRDINPAPDNTAYVGEYIDSLNTNCTVTDGKLTLNVTATVGTNPHAQSETRVYEVIPRPNV